MTFRLFFKETELMKSCTFLNVFAATCSLLVAGTALCAGSIPSWNITGSTSVKDCGFPALSGTTLVWQAKGGLAGSTSGSSDWEIFLYDIGSRALIQITDDDDDDIAPQTDSDYVVWQKYTQGQGNRIFLYSLQGGSPQGGGLISRPEDPDNYAPKIAAGRVVWTAQAVVNSYENGRIMLYSAADSAGPVVISNPAKDCSDPRIDVQQAAWMQHDGNGTETLYIYDPRNASAVAQPAPEVFMWNRSPAVDGEQKVLSRYDGTDREIVLYNRTEGYVQITDNALVDSTPVVSQNHIAWVADGDIYLAEIAQYMHVQVPSVSGGLGTEFLALWDELTGGVDAYFLDVSTDPAFRTFVEGFRELNVGTATRFQVDGLTPDETYYYRVHASINGSTTADSKTVPVKLSTPSPFRSGNLTFLPFIYRLLLE